MNGDGVHWLFTYEYAQVWILHILQLIGVILALAVQKSHTNVRIGFGRFPIRNVNNDDVCVETRGSTNDDGYNLCFFLF